MRIHRLEVQAFGPFAGREQVDFTALNEAGLFLLDGPTGSGKSTVLAAVCFALYGTVPGGRSADSVASTHAPVGTRPEVLLDLTVGGRRFEVLRWPRYLRPRQRRSKDGSRYTEEKSGAQLRELVHGAWQEVSVRADEIGQLLRTVLPLDAAQFMHVIMLPQGEFARFLRSDSKEKEALLRRLFGTDRFDQVEKHLAARHQQLAETVRQDQEYTARIRDEVLQVLAERLGPAEGPAEDPGEVSEQGAPSELGTLSDQDLADHAERAVTEAVHQADLHCEQSETALDTARSAIESLVLTRRQLTAAQGWTDRDRLHRQEREHVAQDRLRLESHRRAAPVVRRAEDVQTAEQAELRARTAAEETASAALADEHCRAWDAADGGVSAAADEGGRFRRLVARADRALDALAAQEKDAERWAALGVGLAQEPARRESLEERVTRAETSIADRSAERIRLEERLAALSGAAVPLERTREAVAAAESQLAAAREVERLEKDLLRQEEDHRTARDAALDARERWQDLIQQRLDNAAALLAAELENGTPCPVCGSSEHPAPSSAGEAGEGMGELSTQALDRARAASEQADTARDAARASVQTLAQQLADQRLAAGGLEVQDAQDLLTQAREGHARARQAVAELESGAERRQELQSAEETARQDLQAARDELAELRANTALQEQEYAALGERLQAALQGRDSLEQLRQEMTRARGLAEAADHAQDRLTLARAQAEHERTALARELEAAGCQSPDQARAALLDTAAEQAAADRVQASDREQAALAELAASEDVRLGRELIAQGIQPPSQDQEQDARERLAEAERQRRQALSERGALGALQQQIAAQATGLRQAHERSAEQRRRAEEAEGLLQLVRGGGENDYRMRLASYVLAGRLEDVAQAATERLLTMTDGRYELVHDDSASGSRRRGLDLVVRDLYTDTLRPATTLSGGETFMASLALALGLADTVQAEAGGVEMDTLFIDEGFGSLDAETLDQVMEVLAGLQDGGRTLGLVSHVDRMRQEIGYRLQVTKTRHGSHLEVVLPSDQQGYAGEHAS